MDPLRRERDEAAWVRKGRAPVGAMRTALGEEVGATDEFHTRSIAAFLLG